MAALWIVGFACYLRGLVIQPLSILAMVLIVSSPFVLAMRVKRFRDAARDGILSFRRGYAYSVYAFFYGGVLLALAQYIYFAFIDQGFLLSQMNQFLASADTKQLIEQAGLTDMLNESLKAMADTRPIDFALNSLTMSIFAGLMLGLPIAAAVQRTNMKSARQ